MKPSKNTILILIGVMFFEGFFGLLLAQETTGRSCFVLSYNVENLFDTIPSGRYEDEAFSPNGAYGWNTQKYRTKIQRIRSVLSSVCAWEMPSLICLNEIETAGVVEDLLGRFQVNGRPRYAYAVSRGRDRRGIELALAWDRSLFRKICQKDIPNYGADLPSGRHSLHVRLVTCPDEHQSLQAFEPDTLDLIGMHLPSRRGGVRASEKRRLQACHNIIVYIDSLLKDRPRAKLILLGDTNENPEDPALSLFLNPDKGWRLYNFCQDLYKQGRYSHVYQGQKWFPDQILLSESLLNASNGLSVSEATEAEVYAPDFLLEEPKRKAALRYPKRSFRGTFYQGGYSDHLPVKLRLELLD